MFSPTERQSSLGHAPPEDPQSHYDLPVNSHIPGHYDLPPVRRPPSPRRTPQWLSERVSSSWLWGWIQARSRKKKEQTFSSPLTIRAAVRLLSHWGTVVYSGGPPPPPFFDSTPPLCGPKWYSLHRDRLVIQTGCGEEGWTVATPAGLQLRSPPMGKTLPKIFTVKSSHMGMFMCLNSSERAPIEIFHIFCLLPISCLNFLSLLSEFKIF